MKFTTPDTRLCLAANFVRQDAIFADIGTDHAYLPAFLLREGRIRHAVCSDVNAGPLDAARRTLEDAGLIDRATLVLTSGLIGLEKFGLTDIAICGMGGELIAQILDASPYIKKEGIRLVLQPMTKPAAVREYLAAEGFAIVGEGLCRASGRIYAAICAEYTGEAYRIDTASAELGLADRLTAGRELFAEYAERKIYACRARIAAREGASLDASDDRAWLLGAEALLEKHKNGGKI